MFDKFISNVHHLRRFVFKVTSLINQLKEQLTFQLQPAQAFEM